MWLVQVGLGALVCLFWGAACLFAGLGVLHLGHERPRIVFPPNASASSALAFALGVALIGGIAHVFALFHILTATWTAALLIFGILFGLWSVLPMQISFLALRRQALATLRVPLLWYVVLGLLAVLLFYLFLETLSAPGTDATAYYLAQAKLIAGTGRFVPVDRYDKFLHLGLYDELNLAALMIFGGEVAAKMSVFFVALGCAAILWAICARLGLGIVARWTSVVALFTSTAFTLVLWDGKTDLYPTLLGLAAIYAALCIASPVSAMSVITGMLASAAILTKPSFIIVLPPVLAAVAMVHIWTVRADAGGRVAFSGKMIIGLSIGALIALAPVMLKNSVLFAEPLAPFWYFHAAGFILDQAWYSVENTRHLLLTYPLALTFGSYPMQHGNLSPLVLAFAPLALLGLIRPRKPGDTVSLRMLTSLTIGGLIAVIAWAAIRPSVLAPRYILPALIVLIPIVCYGVERVWRSAGWWGLKIASVLVCIIFVLTAVNSLHGRVWIDLAYVQQTPANYGDPIWQTAAIVNREGPPGTRIDLKMWHRSMLRVDVLQCVLNANEESEVNSAPEPWSKLHEFGIRFMIFDRATHGKALVGPLSAVPAWLRVTETRISDRFSLYRLEPGDGAPPPRKECREVAPNTWQVVPTSG